MINIKRSPAPTHQFKYTDDIIKEKVRDDFFHLCYICEEYVPVSFEIDHFFPKGQKEFEHLTHEWTNLFCICSKCNKERPKDINTKGKEVLNNCIDDVEKIINLRYENSKVEVIANGNTNEIKNTVKLLNRIFNGIGAPDENKRSHIHRREAVKKVLDKFENFIEKYNKNNSLFEDEIENCLSKKTKNTSSAYVSFKRQLVKDKYKEFEKYFD